MEFIDQKIAEGKVVMFSKSYCPYCKKAKDLFAGINQPIVVVELDKMDNGSDLQAKLLAKTGQRTVPNVFINGKHIGGCDDTSKLFSSGQIKTML